MSDTFLSIIYSTSRKNPRLHWFLDALSKQSKGRKHEVIVIDFHANQERRMDQLANDGDYRFYLASPKPTALQGPHRQTSRDFFCPSNSRNTGACYANGNHLAFVDDLTVLGPQWFDQVWHCAEDGGYVMLGAYKKLKDMVVDNGELVSHTEFPAGVDSRWNHGSDKGNVRASGSWLFGCSFSLPLEWYLNVGGMDEACDGIGGEDSFLGINLERAGYPFYYNRNALTLESEEAHYEDTPMIRLDKRMGDTYSSNVLLDRLMKETSPVIYGNDYHIRDLRNLIKNGDAFPLPKPDKVDWRDGQPYKDM